jgi:hypothetical protein
MIGVLLVAARQVPPVACSGSDRRGGSLEYFRRGAAPEDDGGFSELAGWANSPSHL